MDLFLSSDRSPLVRTDRDVIDSGKGTIPRLVARTYGPTEGTILVDGVGRTLSARRGGGYQ